MRIIDEIKRVFREEDEEIAPQMLKRIKASEKTMRLIDTMPDETYSPWYRMYLSSSGKVQEEIFSLAMERAEKFRNLSSFLRWEGDYGDIACERALPMATTSACFREIARISRNPITKKKGAEGALATAKTPKDCSELICVLSHMELEDEDLFIKNEIEKATEKATVLTKNLYELYLFWELVFWRCQIRPHEKKDKLLHRVDFILAKGLTSSPLVFDHKRLLKAQVELCQKRNEEGDIALYALLRSVLEFGRYEYFSTDVPKQQRRLKTN